MTHSNTSELAHDILQRTLVLLQQSTKLFILMLQRLILQNQMRRELLELRAEFL
jgi:hypothetical protein